MNNELMQKPENYKHDFESAVYAFGKIFSMTTPVAENAIKTIATGVIPNLYFSIESPEELRARCNDLYCEVLKRNDEIHELRAQVKYWVNKESLRSPDELFSVAELKSREAVC